MEEEEDVYIVLSLLPSDDNIEYLMLVLAGVVLTRLVGADTAPYSSYLMSAVTHKH